MKQNPHLQHLLWLTLATIFISTSGSLGKYIDMPTLWLFGGVQD